MLLCCSTPGCLWGPVCERVYVCLVGVGVVYRWAHFSVKRRHWISLGELEPLTVTQDGGPEGTGEWRRGRKGWARARFSGVPTPWGESRTVYPDIPAAAESQGCFQDSAAKVSWNSSAQRHMLGSLLREISFLGKLKQRNFLCGQTELPDLKASWKGNSFIMKWQIKDIPAGFTSKQLVRVQAKPYYTPSQNKNKSHPDRFLYAGLYPSPRTFLHSLLPLPSSHPRH